MTVRLAVPNKGRLKDPAIRLLKDAGLSFEVTDRSLTARLRNAAIELLFVRTEDVAELVDDGVADAGITGQDLLAEDGADLEQVLELGFGHCRVSAAVPSTSQIRTVGDMAGLRVATSHPRIAQEYFDRHGINVDVVRLRGSVEVAPKLGIADAIVDLVSTGSTLVVNGLREVGTLLDSQAVLVWRAGHTHVEAARLETAIRSVVGARSKRYIVLNAPQSSVDEIARIIPGLEAPTVVPLAETGWVAIHSVVSAGEVWSLLPLLESAGGQGILVLPITQVLG
ncbi:MAG TPA: ATP phosphoribosyltransferase [Acidimicrobiia bacterium]|nr:ATP phosphoribosyltransferase [Acidimicrobiia bacterium]